MAIIKAPRNITVTVPRHNSQVIGAKLDKEIKKQAKAKNIRADIAQPNAELAQSIESASEWNSLLITARAERGPQWDIGTQQFLVEEFSDLYYDPTLLFEAVNKVKEEEGVGGSSSGANDQQHQPPGLPPHHHQMQTPQHPHGPPQHHVSQYNMGSPRHQTPMRGGERDAFHPAQMGGGQHMPEPSPLRHGHGGGGMQGNFGGFPASPGGMNMRGPPGAGSFPVSGGVVPGQGGGPGGAAPFNPMQQQQQFFNAGGGNPAVVSPMRMPSMGGGMGMDDHGMGGMGGMGMGGGMQGMGVGGAPQMTRRMTRGMGDGFN
ncbi:hypothetical protein H1R20_g12223, partial [Candolleomyces eurysporus]